MIIGDPYKFAILFQRIETWNRNLTDNNGVFALCINGKIFPSEIINAIIPISIRDIKKSLINIPINEKIFDMDTKDSFNTLYKLVYPESDNNDYRYQLSVTEMNDENCLVFATQGRGKIKILASKLEYNFEESTHLLDDAIITEIILEKNDIDEIINKLAKEELKYNN